jgi:uncharacterized protein YgiM (DUF1202 family)
VRVSALEPFTGTVNDNNINIRADSNTSSQIICNVPKGTEVEVLSEKYDWYKIKLPKNAALYVKKTLIEPIDKKTGKVDKDNVNMRLAPNESSAILGRLDKAEIIAILEDTGEWYKILPNDKSFGWINKKFVDKTVITAPESNVLETASKEEFLIFEGIIQPYGKVLNRVATHKLITKDYNIILLRGTPANLNTYTYHKVRITGKPVLAPKQKYPVIEIIKMEALD